MNQRRPLVWLLLLGGLGALVARPDKPAPSAPKIRAPLVVVPQVIKDWRFNLTKDEHTQGRFHGDTAQIVGPNEFQVTTFHVDTYRPDGEGDLTADSPACRVRITTNGFLVTSPGPIQLIQANGRFSLTGEGFRWDHGAQRFTVSNKVVSILLLSLPRPETRGTP